MRFHSLTHSLTHSTSHVRLAQAAVTTPFREVDAVSVSANSAAARGMRQIVPAPPPPPTHKVGRPPEEEPEEVRRCKKLRIVI